MASLWRRVRAVPLRVVPRVAAQLIRRQLRRSQAPLRPRPLADEDLLAALELRSANAGQDASARLRAAVEQFRLGPPVLAVPRALEPAPRGRIVQQAEAARAHVFDVLGSGPVRLGPVIPWRRDFKSGHEWPREHFSRLTIVRPGGGFDIKVPWELSRFHHGVRLAQARALTGDDGYAGEFAAQVLAWLEDNPPEFGPNWANAMEAAIRSANWLAAYDLLRDSPALNLEFHLAFLKGLLAHGRYIASHLEDGWPGSNHFLADLCGLVWLGASLPQFREAAGWLQTGLSGLRRELGRQVYADGADYEASTGYHYLVTEMVAWAALVCRARGLEAPQPIRARLRQMLDVLAGLMKPDGWLPAFGDLDSGRWLVLESDQASLASGQDPGGLLALGAVALGEPGRWPAAEDRGAAAQWLQLAAEAVTPVARSEPSVAMPRANSVHRPRAAMAAPAKSVAFRDAGWYVMRQGEHYLAAKAGGNGAEGWGLHAHNDALSFELAVGARAFLVDPGSFVYSGDYEARNAFRSTAAHNTLRLDGAEINRIPADDLFRLENDARVRVLAWETGPERDFLAAEHTGYASLGAIHRRDFLFDKAAGLWVIRDHLRAARAAGAAGRPREYSVEIYFHFAPLPVEASGPEVRTACAEGVNLLIAPVDAPGLALALTNGWVSPRYGVRVAAPVACYSARARLPAAFTFVLWPLRDSAERPDAQSATLQRIPD
jgi:hypothetical protein